MARPIQCPNCKTGWVYDSRETGERRCNYCPYIETIEDLSRIDVLKGEIKTLEGSSFLSDQDVLLLVRKKRELAQLYKQMQGVIR